jgi:hypothetical protein
MPRKPVAPDDEGKHLIHGKNDRNLSLKFAKSTDLANFTVEELTDNDITAKIPVNYLKTPTGATITWFAGFNVNKKSDGQPAANVNYDVDITYDNTKQFWVYDGELREVTSEVSRNGKIRFTRGDPAVGNVP